MNSGLITRLKQFAAQPFNPQGDVVNWALFVVFAITVAIAWRQVLGHIVHVAEEV